MLSTETSEFYGKMIDNVTNVFRIRRRSSLFCSDRRNLCQTAHTCLHSDTDSDHTAQLRISNTKICLNCQ